MLIGRTEPHSDDSLVHLAASEACSRAIVAEMLVNCRTLPGFAVRSIAVHSLARSVCGTSRSGGSSTAEQSREDCSTHLHLVCSIALASACLATHRESIDFARPRIEARTPGCKALKIGFGRKEERRKMECGSGLF